MTCIIAFKCPVGTVLAGDKEGSNGWNAETYPEPKIFQNKDYFIGGSGSFRLLQLLEHVWEPPETVENCYKAPDMKWLVGYTVPTIQQMLIDNQFDIDKNNSEAVLIYNNEIYHLQNDLSLLRHDKFTASGNGWLSALSILHFADLEALKTEEDVEEFVVNLFDAVGSHIMGVSRECNYIIC